MGLYYEPFKRSDGYLLKWTFVLNSHYDPLIMNYGTLELGIVNLVDWELWLWPLYCDPLILHLWWILWHWPLILNLWYWIFDTEPLILNLWYWTFDIEPLILTWHLHFDIEPLLLDPSVFYPGVTCCGVATTIALMHQCYVL